MIAVGAIGLGVIVTIGVVVSLLLVHPATLAVPTPTPTPPPCPKVAPVKVGKFLVPAGPLAGYCQPQLINAAHIMEAGRVYGAPLPAQDIAVMTAIGESSLQNLTYGDKAGPDSRGLFQQRKNWGPLAARMDPYTASHAFYVRLLGLPNWASLSPTHAAHIVQGNRDAEYYAQFFSRAQLLVGELDARTILPSPVQGATPSPTSSPTSTP